MNMHNITLTRRLVSKLGVSLMIISLYGCGTAHIRNEIQSSDIHQYKNVQIGDVQVYSTEEAAKGNVKLQDLMGEWTTFIRGELENYLESSSYQLVADSSVPAGRVLKVSLDVHLTYGNRAVRWLVGFGAGKGRVESVLKGVDAETGEVKLHLTAESDLAVGGAGGNMKVVLMKNVEALIAQYPRAAGTTTQGT